MPHRSDQETSRKKGALEQFWLSQRCFSTPSGGRGRMFSDGSGIFQQDLVPCHTGRAVPKFFKDNQTNVLDWTEKSPYLNPIEDLWVIIKVCLRSKDYTTKIKLNESIIQIWYHDEEIAGRCKQLVEFMPNRVKELIKNHGEHIPVINFNNL